MTARAHVEHDADGAWLVIDDGTGATTRYHLADLLAAVGDPDPDAYRMARGDLLRAIRRTYGDAAAWDADVALAALERERGLS